MQVMTWSKPKPESVKEFKVPGVFWKADERDESSKVQHEIM
jgi:inorganic pyrophosphatase